MDATKHTFYAEPACFAGGRVVLPDNEARHASKVLRLSVGDVIRVVDGAGRAYAATLDRVDKRAVTGHVEEGDESVRERGPHVVLGMALLKHSGRFETLLEKSVELGVSEIVPLVTRRSERSTLKVPRARAILISAMKQSGRTVLPTLHDPSTAVAFFGTESAALKLVCHEGAGRDHSLADVLAGRPDSVRLAIGPEGGFDDSEIALADRHGFRIVSLGPRRLRSETAGMAALAIISMMTPGFA